MTSQELKDLSYKKLEELTGYYGGTNLKDIIDCFKVRGWSGNQDFEAIFVVGKHGKVDIKKLT